MRTINTYFHIDWRNKSQAFRTQVICDDFFVPVLEIICDTMDLKPDVAGATFMAAGTSSPEFFSNIMGTFVTKSDLGIGTIVGSAVFNVFGVIAVCGLFSGREDGFSVSSSMV